MQLADPSDEHLRELMTWFPSQSDLDLWSGTKFKYPFDFFSFKTDLNAGSLRSHAYISSNSELIGFGQYYARIGRCHLARLVINPAFRGRGMVTAMIEALSAAGTKELKTQSCSLFVFEYNMVAIKVYQSIGFLIEKYPENIPLDGCLYMVKQQSN